jgi:hypothetical protein
MMDVVQVTVSTQKPINRFRMDCLPCTTSRLRYPFRGAPRPHYDLVEKEEELETLYMV